ncbi:hypothetical protein BJ944DRAFT_276191, partial [Cunninghamella echinulata]
LLIAIPNIPGIIKQFLAIPLLAANILYPLIFSSHAVLNFLAAPFCFTVNLRFLELFYVGPLLQDRPVYTSLYSLWVDFWSCLKTFPKSENNTKKNDKESEIKTFYHILTSLLITIIFFDILTAWLSSFTPYNMLALEKEQPVLYLGFFVFVILFLTCGFNVAGYSLQLLHCIIIDKGSYSSVFEKIVKSQSQRYLPSHIYNSFPVRILKGIWLMMFGAIFFSIFFEGFLYWGIINLHPFQFSKPYIHTFVKSHPQLLSYFGSNI